MHRLWNWKTDPLLQFRHTANQFVTSPCHCCSLQGLVRIPLMGPMWTPEGQQLFLLNFFFFTLIVIYKVSLYYLEAIMLESKQEKSTCLCHMMDWAIASTLEWSPSFLRVDEIGTRILVPTGLPLSSISLFNFLLLGWLAREGCFCPRLIYKTVEGEKKKKNMWMSKTNNKK